MFKGNKYGLLISPGQRRAFELCYHGNEYCSTARSKFKMSWKQCSGKRDVTFFQDQERNCELCYLGNEYCATVQNFVEMVENKLNFDPSLYKLNSHTKVILVLNVTLKSCFPEIRFYLTAKL